ncbi:MAG: sigma-E factor negative regulatory protein [Burkholderiaceae bacterium]|nr:sigma-E factor negative regulatory protein [Burkholderiaceae bacterium]
MLNPIESAEPPSRQALSALMDGQLEWSGDGREPASPCAAWRDDAEARATWHAYHLIGDVLRSEDLAQPAARDQAFLQALRQRLAAEPVPLAPAPLASPALTLADAAVAAPLQRARRSWQRRMAPAAVAAGVVAVVSVVAVTRMGGNAGWPAGGVMASGGASGAGLVLVGADRSGGAGVPAAVLRDSRIDRYMAAHRKLANDVVVADRPVPTIRIVHEPQ